MSYRSRPSLGEPPRLPEIISALTARERLLYWIAAANFVAFVVLWFVLGGNALNGGIEDGRYFLGSKGSRAEVSSFVFHYSVLHTLSLFVTQPIGVFLGFRGRRRVIDERAEQ